MVLGEEVLLYYHSRHALEDNLENSWIVKFLTVSIQYNMYWIGYIAWAKMNETSDSST